jgi:TIR domain
VAFDVFISYASKDKTVADAVCARLESAGIRCWIAPRDIVASTSYGEAIIDAIHGAKVMVLVFSSSANASGHIPKEVERAVSSGVPILPFRIEDVAPGKSLDYFIGSVHWLDAMTPPMETHLDNLAATVHKLIPENPDEQGAGPLPPTVIWQHGASPEVAAAIAAAKAQARPVSAPQPAAVREAMPAQAVQPPVVRQPSAALPTKAIWIGVAAVVVLLVGWMALRGSGSSTGGNDVPAATNPASNEPASGPNPPSNEVAPTSKTQPASPRKTPPSPSAHGGVDPIVGCYQYSNGGPAVVRADGTVTGTATWKGHWAAIAPGHIYTITWPVMIETLTLSPDQRSMSGGNQFGFPITGGRVSGTSGLAGTWRWANGWTVNVASNGTFTSPPYSGTWHATDASRGIYEMFWPAPVDSITLVGGARFSGVNQYGVGSSAVKTGACN